MATIGYSGKPLSSKLGIVAGSTVVALGGPEGYRELLEPLPKSVRFESQASASSSVVHLITTREAELSMQLHALRKTISPQAMVWVSWPKKSSQVPCDITEDTIRAVALPMGFVDAKVCAVTEVWSGLKLVIRKSHR